MEIDPITSRKIARLVNILPRADLGEYLKITNFRDKEKWLVKYLNSEKGKSVWNENLKSEQVKSEIEEEERINKMNPLSRNVIKTLNFLDKPEFEIFKAKFNQTFGLDFKDAKNIFVNGSAQEVDIKKDWFKDWGQYWAVIQVDKYFCLVKQTGTNYGHLFGCFVSHEQAEKAIQIISSNQWKVQEEIDSYGGAWFGID